MNKLVEHEGVQALLLVIVAAAVLEMMTWA